MSTFDSGWAINEIDQFLNVTAQISPATGPDVLYFGTVVRGPETEIYQRAHMVEQILDRTFAASWRTGRPTPDPEYDWLRESRRRVGAPRSNGETSSPSTSVTAHQKWMPPASTRGRGKAAPHADATVTSIRQ